MNEEWFDAAQYGEIKTLQKFIQNEQHVNIQNQNGWTALMMAALNGHHQCIDCLRLLLQLNASTDIRNKWGTTALMMAANVGFREGVKLLLQSNASTDIQDNFGWTALMKAACHGNHRCVKLLLNFKASIDIREETQGWTALVCAANNECYRCVKLLLQAGADPSELTPFRRNVQIQQLLNEFQIQLEQELDVVFIPNLAALIVQFMI